MLKTKEEIRNWLDSYKIDTYNINDDLTVDVNGDVDLSDKELKEIPVQFGNVNGNFYCEKNSLTSCKGFPLTMTGDLLCSYNKLVSLEGCPEDVGMFRCGNNELTSLVGAPKKCHQSFSCSNNKLTTLDGSPEYVGGRFYCDNNPIKTLANFSCVMNRFIHTCSKESMIPNYESFYKDVNVFGRDEHKVSFVGNYSEIMAIVRNVELNKELSKLEVKETKIKRTKV